VIPQSSLVTYVEFTTKSPEQYDFKGGQSLLACAMAPTT
jgi:hypothetical protein